MTESCPLCNTMVESEPHRHAHLVSWYKCNVCGPFVVSTIDVSRHRGRLQQEWPRWKFSALL